MANLPQMIQGFSIEGNLKAEEKIALSLVEAQVMKILQSENFLVASRLGFTASQIEQLQGAGVAVYRLPERLVHGTDYDFNTGAVKQNTKANTASLILDQYITIKFMYEKMDIERVSKSSPDVAASLIAEWSASVVTNAMMNHEAMFIEAVQNYHIMRYENDKDAVLVLDMENIKTEEEAKSAMYAINSRIIKKLKVVDQTIVGTNKADWLGVLKLEAMAGLTRGYTNIVASDISANTLAQGKLYKNAILGTDVVEHNYLGMEFAKNDGTRINKDKTYKLDLMQGFFLHNKNCAFPMGYSEMVSLIDNETANLKTMGKSIMALPMFLRGVLGFIVMAQAPTAEQIADAKKSVYRNQGEKNMTCTLQVARWDIDEGYIKLDSDKPTPDTKSANVINELQDKVKEQEKIIQDQARLQAEVEEYKKMIKELKETKK